MPIKGVTSDEKRQLVEKCRSYYQLLRETRDIYIPDIENSINNAALYKLLFPDDNVVIEGTLQKYIKVTFSKRDVNDPVEMSIGRRSVPLTGEVYFVGRGVCLEGRDGKLMNMPPMLSNYIGLMPVQFALWTPNSGRVTLADVGRQRFAFREYNLERTTF